MAFPGHVSAQINSFATDRSLEFAKLGVLGIIGLTAISVAGILGWKYLNTMEAHVEAARKVPPDERDTRVMTDARQPELRAIRSAPETPVREEVRDTPANNEPPPTAEKRPTESSGAVAVYSPPPAYRPSAVEPTPPASSYEPPSNTSVPAAPEIPRAQIGGTIRNASLWNHNGSTMVLIASGKRRQFYYHAPRSGMLAVGVQNGTLLFDGVRNGNSYSGTAYVFAKGCPPAGFRVTGTVLNGDNEVLMHGQAPRTRNCNVVDYVESSLRFTYEQTVSDYSFDQGE